MTSPRILMASPNYWDSPFQVGSHHLARGFVRAGWKVAYVSDPISPWHFLRGFTPDLRHRLSINRHRGCESANGNLWTYVPASLITPHNKPFLRTHYVARHWNKWSLPNLVSIVRSKGFDSVDLLYIDSLSQSFWLDVLTYKKAVYRVADYNPHFEKYTPALRTLEREMAQRVDLVVYPSHNLKGYVEELGARRSYCLPNGVDFEHFAKEQSLPDEYKELRGPIAVYMGVMPYWFHFDWVRQAAQALAEVSFVLIGPTDLACHEFKGLPNIHLLDVKAYETLPAYLQHAQVGLMPFDIAKNPAGVNVLNPQKLYAYLACGLPVVSADWEEIRRVNSPARLCETADQFIAGIGQALAERGDPKSFRQYASGFDWKHRVPELLGAFTTSERVWTARSA
jgi:glycosyltransferase involved in cell wall biosynthesis